MKRLSLLAAVWGLIPFFVAAQPIHDDCQNAISLTNLGNWQSVLVDLTTATESLDASCETPTDLNRDVWYVLTMPFDGKLRVNSVTASSTVSLYDACGGLELSCQSGSSYFDSLSNGNTYYLRYASALGGITTDNISVQAFGQIPNENCASAAIIPNIDNPQTITIDLRSAYEELDASCETPTLDNFDAWYEFVMPFDGKIEIAGLSTVNFAALFDQCGGMELACMAGSGFFDSLQANTTYYLRYSTAANFANVNSFAIQAFPPPLNDECNGAILIPFIDTLQSIAVDTRGASESINASCENASSDNFDMWYTFTMPYDGKIKLSGLSVTQKIAIYDQCGGTEIACLSGTGFIDGLMAGTSYFLKYGTASIYAGNNVFSIQAFGIPPNDECANAESISNIANEQVFIADPRGASQSILGTCENGLNEHYDLWYVFTMPFDGKIEVSGVFGVNRIAIFDSCGGTELGCQLSGGFFYGMSGGSTYYLRYSSLPLQAVNDAVAIQAFPAPLNDECADALPISNLDTPQQVFLDTREATESLDISCETAADNNLDLWYHFVMPFDGKVEVTDVFGVNKLALFDSCAGTELDCFASNGFFNGLSGGTQYVLRYAALAAQANADQITVQAFPTVANDECQNAFLLTNLDSLQIVFLDTRPATESLDASCEDPLNDNLDLWYQFVMPFNGKLELDGLAANRIISIFDSCGSSELRCFSGGGTIYGLRGGQSYILRYATPSPSADLDNFSIQAIPPPAYDTCSSAIELDSVETGQWIYQDLREGTQSLLSSCEIPGIEHADFWYRFTMPFDGRVDLISNNSLLSFSLHTACDSSELTCFTGTGQAPNLLADSTYFLRCATPFQAAILDSFYLEAVFVLDRDDGHTLRADQLKVFPNPTRETLYAQLPDHAIASTVVFDFNGRYKAISLQENQNGTIEIDIRILPPGVYVLHITDQDGGLHLRRFQVYR